ncbi:NAD(P)-binding domain-containing protein [Streptomyces sp. NP-1717]|uniref:lactate/malate family dehydrogenase n=1 Tax=Streptomyces sp. NP-1717 TaxID=2704470 RepID=UPI001F5D157A|nr:NAD(P)-binding domain-containing protein [Streptomyces sp. NP-1717]MCI3223817.1 NAD(P)-binding domain-containing protein [Streptomyces sp. NP-1717]
MVTAAVVGVVGVGAVGQTLAAGLVAAALPGRLLVVSRQPDQVRALTADLQDLAHAAHSPTVVERGDVADLHGCDAVVIALRASFTNTAEHDIRRGGAFANAPAVGTLATRLRGFTGTVLVVTNPVDLMTRRFAEVSGCARVFGIGSDLDSARFRLLMARYARVLPEQVRGHVIGEHGDRSVICASSTTVNGLPVHVPIKAVAKELQQRPALIRTGTGRTRCGPAGAVLSTLRKSLGLADGIEELSVPYQDVWLGIPTRFTGGRAEARLPHLTSHERQRLERAATSLRDAYTRIPAHTERIAP